ncbi:MAG: hypothetical protein B7Z80_14520 [Rhodospirillales bacterium 20-64-7]|nr:MAG: hypothetical protein B7Z80_14520 [Rhodospirillales bacterium 20-64-7]
MSVEQINADLIAAFDVFIAVPPGTIFNHRKWLHVLDEDHYTAVSLYIRFGYRFVEGQQRLCVTIASIEVAACYQGFGLFTNLLQHALEVCRALQYTVTVESVLNEHVERVVRRFGFSPHPHDPQTFSYVGRNVDSTLAV